MKVPTMSTSTLTLLMLFALLLSSIDPVQPMPPKGIECHREGIMQSCLEGCLSCWKDFGSQVYDMNSCCRACRQTKSWIIDYSPSQCSLANARSSWLKRFGK